MTTDSKLYPQLFVLLGAVTLAAWNFYLSGIGFFISSFGSVRDDVFGDWAFMASLAYQTTNLVGMAGMLWFGTLFPFKPTYVAALILQVMCVVALVTLALHADGSHTYWYVGMVVVFVLGFAESAFTALVCGLTASLGEPSLMGKMMAGQGVIGVIGTPLLLTLEGMSGTLQEIKLWVVLCFFGVCVALQVFAILIVNWVPAVRTAHSGSILLKNVSSAQSLHECGDGTHGPPLNTRKLVNAVWQQLANVFVVFLVTFTLLSIGSKWQPQITMLVNSPVGGILYTSLVYGVFGICDVVGRYTPQLMMKCFTPNRLWTLVAARFVLIPVFMFLQRYPDIPGGPAQNILELLAMAVFALTNGWAATLAMMYGPQKVEEPREQQSAGVLMELGLVGGIWIGSLVALLTQIGVH